MTTVDTFRVALIAAAILAAAGCSRFDDGITAASTPELAYDVEGLVRTESDTYAFVERREGYARVRELTVEYAIRNPGFSPLYLARCGGGDPAPTLIKFHDGSWMPALGLPCPAIWTPPIRIEPGEQDGDHRSAHPGLRLSNAFWIER